MGSFCQLSSQHYTDIPFQPKVSLQRMEKRRPSSVVIKHSKRMSEVFSGKKIKRKYAKSPTVVFEKYTSEEMKGYVEKKTPQFF